MSETGETSIQAAHRDTSALKYPGLLGKAHAKLSEYREAKRFVKFSIVGAIGFVIDFGTSNLLWVLLRSGGITLAMPFGLAPLSYIGIGQAIGFTAAVTSNFLWNRYWTYPDSRSKKIWTQLATFFGINIVGLAIRTPIIENGAIPLGNLAGMLLHGYLPGDWALWIGKNLALAIGVVVVMFWNFFANRYLTYGDVR